MHMIYLDDLTPPTDKKEKRHTIVVNKTDDELIQSVREILGKQNTAEIMRRAIRFGLSEALTKFKGRAV